MEKTLLCSRYRSQLFPSRDYVEQFSLVGHRRGTFCQCQFLVPYLRGRDRGYQFLPSVPRVLALLFFVFCSRKVCENFQFCRREGSYLLLRLITVCEFLAWVGRWSVAPRCCSLGCGDRGLGIFLTRVFSFLLIQIIGVEYCLQVAGVMSRTS